MNFISKIYDVTKNFPSYEMYGLSTQLRRSAISISLNIAEGSGAHSDAEFRRFLIISLRSAYEVGCGIEVAHRLKYLHDEQKDAIESECSELTAMIQGFVNSLN